LHKVITGQEETEGILLRLNTPGGTAGASEEVANMLLRVRNKGIPIVATIADVCCSGGYMIACASNYIFSNEMSITGSIGVIMQIPNYQKLADKVGVNFYTIKSGEMKDIGNPVREMTENEKAYLEDSAKRSHELFKKMVRKNRWDGEQKEILEDGTDLFDGRPIFADDAVKYGLVDCIGTYYDALGYLLHEIRIDEDEIEIVPAIKKKSKLSKLLSFDTESIIESTLSKVLNNQISVR